MYVPEFRHCRRLTDSSGSYQGTPLGVPLRLGEVAGFSRCMAIPARNSQPAAVVATERAFFVTSSTWGKQALLQSDRSAQLFLDVTYHYRSQGKFRLHDFVIMPDHFHLLIGYVANPSNSNINQLQRLGTNWDQHDRGTGSQVLSRRFHPVQAVCFSTAFRVELKASRTKHQSTGARATNVGCRTMERPEAAKTS